MIKTWTATLLLLTTAATAPLLQAQEEQDPQTLKQRILDRVRAKLAKERKAFLDKVERIIDEELKKTPVTKAKPADPKPGPDAPTDEEAARKLERELRMLEEKKEQLEAQKARLERLKKDDTVRRLAKEEGPHDGQEAKEMFDVGIERHVAGDYDASVKFFKRIYYNFPDTQIGVISAYNVACGYALAGKKDHALDWLELSVEGGYRDFAHMRDDKDLESLRRERRYHRLLIDR